MRNFKQMFICKNRSGKPLKPIGMVLHETATYGATAKAEYNYFNNNKVGASVHGFIDWNEDIQTAPWFEKCGHAKEPANSMFIGLEMCNPAKNDPERKAKMKIVYNATVDAFARVFHFILDIKIVTHDNLMSHDEVRLKWKNTTHTDPTAYLKEIGLDMDAFRHDVQIKLNELNQR